MLERINGPEKMSYDSQVDVRIIWNRCRIYVLENLVVLSISDVYLRKIVCRSLFSSRNIGAIPRTHLFMEKKDTGTDDEG